MASEDSSITLTASCLCKANVFTTKVSKSKLPLDASACHCDSCRHESGAMHSVDTEWPEPRANVDLSNLKTYIFTPRVETRFCGTCSTPMFYNYPQDLSAPLDVWTGTLANEPGNIVRYKKHIFVGDTLDGGASMWLRKPNVDGTEAQRFKDSNGEYPYNWPETSSLTGYEKRVEDCIPIRCRCKGVDFVLHRGDYSNKKKEELPWFVDPKTHKLIAGSCVCDSCRLSSGVDVFNWTFAELENISFSKSAATEGKSFPRDTKDLKALVDAKDPSVGTLAYYTSSPDVQRYFCSNCCACIFYAVDDRSSLVDVAIGVLEASDGARAEGFLSWAFGSTSHKDDPKGGWREGFTANVIKEGAEWRDERGYPKLR